jgi:hypothetical protein
MSQEASDLEVFFWINDLNERKITGFGTWNIRSVYKGGSLRAVAEEIS